MNHTDNDCLVFVVMTHGKPNRLVARDCDYKLKELWEPFVGDNCRSLIGKPKLFFLQACRGSKRDNGSMAKRVMPDAVDEETVQTSPIIFAIPTMADVLIMYATFDGNLKYNNQNRLNWFFYYFYFVIVRSLRISPSRRWYLVHPVTVQRASEKFR
jgi:caspase 7